jgi:hypothetical protein
MSAGWQLELLDALRFFTLAEGIALIVISAGSLVDAFIYAWPRERKLAISLRLLGRTMLVASRPGSSFTACITRSTGTRPS